MQENPLLICVIGPTASGKSALALRLADKLNGEIVNCDSMQMVRELEIGTAKPGPEERALCPHHLFDLVSVTEVYSAGLYMIQARRTCSEISSRGKVPVVTGGTGLYLRALLQGMFEGPSRLEG
ncbi:MAG: tRNA (adenosine(37)-N6)-dimethylallyltransferase MiaA, partial [Anaerolineales bacterium]|nr:tRNA (adenosine(37)-N6)-dimethylallyltransferase MiaA [Anaerolineales bacterium]